MIRTFRSTWLAAAVTCSITPFAAAAVEDLATLFPENTTFLLSATDLGAIDKLEEHSVVKIISTPELKKAFAPTIGKWTEQLEKFEKYWKDEAGLNRRELQDLFPGGIALGVTLDPDALKEANKAGKKFTELDRDETPMAIVAHFSGDEAKAKGVMEALMRSSPTEDEPGDKPKLVFPDDFNSESDDDRGVKLHIWTPKKERKYNTTAWALHDKVLIMANSEANLRASLDRARNNGASLATATTYKEVATRVKGGNVKLYAHVQPLIKMGINAAGEKMADSAAPGMPDFGKVMGALGVDRFESIYAMANTKENAVDVELGVTYQQKPGILKIMATSGPGKAPDFFAPDFKTAGYGTFNWSQFMTGVQELIQEAVPQVGAMVNAQLDVIRGGTGVDIQKGLLGSFGPNYWSVSGALEPKLADTLKKSDDDEAAIPQAEPQVMGIEVKDRKGFELALTSLLNYAAPGQALFEKSDYQGYTLHQFKSAPIPLIYLTTDDWFIFSVGPRVLLDKVLTRLSKGGNQENLFSQAHVASAIRALPEGGDGTNYTDLGTMLESLVALVQQVPNAELDEYVDIDALPAQLNIPLALTSRVYNEANSLRFRFHIEEKAKQ